MSDFSKKDPMDWGEVGATGIAYLSVMEELRHSKLEELLALIRFEDESDIHAMMRLFKTVRSTVERFQEFLDEHLDQLKNLEEIAGNKELLDEWNTEMNNAVGLYLAEMGAVIGMALFVFCKYLGKEFDLEATGIVAGGVGGEAAD